MEDDRSVDEQPYWEEPVSVCLFHIEQCGEAAGMEKDKGSSQEKGDLVQFIFGQTPTLGKILKGGHADQCHTEDKQPMGPAVDIVQDQVRVEDKHEGDHRGADIVEETLDAGGDWIGPGNGGGGIGSQADRRSVVCQDAEIEAEQVGCHDGDDEIVEPAHLDNDRRGERGHDNIGGGGRQPHAQQEAGQGGDG